MDGGREVKPRREGDGGGGGRGGGMEEVVGRHALENFVTEAKY